MRKWLAECHAWLDDPLSVEWNEPGTVRWFTPLASGHTPLSRPDLNWRIKPPTIAINGVEVPRPVAYRHNTKQYCLTLCNHSTVGIMDKDFRFNTSEDRDVVFRRLIEVLS